MMYDFVIESKLSMNNELNNNFDTNQVSNNDVVNPVVNDETNQTTVVPSSNANYCTYRRF